MTLLSVNVNKIATLRNSRAKNNPDLVQTARDIVNFGAQGLTVHPRPDERHIKKSDAFDLKILVNEINKSKQTKVEYNIEGYPSDEFLEMIISIKPDQCTLVPDPPDAITSNAGWDFVTNRDLLTKTVQRLKDAGVRCSLFLDPKTFNHNYEQLDALGGINPGRIELYTEKYADDFETFERRITTAGYKATVAAVGELGIECNAGHDLNQKNLGFLISTIPDIKEVSIGHALICESLYKGLESTVKSYLEILQNAHRS